MTLRSNRSSPLPMLRQWRLRRSDLFLSVALTFGAAVCVTIATIMQGAMIDHALDDWHSDVEASLPTAHPVR